MLSRKITVMIAALALMAAPALAGPKAPKGKGAAAKEAAFDAKPLIDKIVSGDAARMVEGIAGAQAAGARAAEVAPSIEELLKRGASTAIVKGAIEALGAIGQASSSAAIRPYLRHRTQDLRRAAAKALVATKGPDAIAAFKEGLRSSDAGVRGYSAQGLGNLGATDALPELFLALDRNVSEAAAAIGQLCRPDECRAFAKKLGKVPFDVMTFGFDAILLRASPLPDDVLLETVGKIRELGTPEAGKYLVTVQGNWPKSGSAKVKQAIDTAIPSIPGAKQ